MTVDTLDRKTNRRILVIDDNPAIHEDFKQIIGTGEALTGGAAVQELAALEALFLDKGDEAIAAPRSPDTFDLTSALQGQEALEKLRQAQREGRPFAMAFVDQRMPPGWDGLQTIQHLWAEDPTLQIVICTAHSDYSWEETRKALGERSDGLLILKKPFDIIEVRQLAYALTEKWELHRAASARLDTLETEVAARTQEIDRSYRRLEQMHKEMRDVYDALPAAVIGLDSNGTIMRFNEVASRLFEVPATAALNKAFAGSLLPIAIAPVISALGTSEKTDLHDITFSRADGRLGFVSVTVCAAPPRGTSEDAERLIFVTDNSEKKLLQVQLLTAQKLESLGQLAAGVAHEINTPTQYAGHNARFLGDAFKDLLQLLDIYDRLKSAAVAAGVAPELVAEAAAQAERIDLDDLKLAAPKAADDALEGLNRIAEIVRAMKQFSHPGGQEKSAIDLNQALTDTLAVSRNEWKYVAEVNCDLMAGLPTVPGMAGELNQVFLNLVINAAHAIADVVKANPDNLGRITVKTTAVDDCVEVRIGDTGTGIPDRIRDRIYDPFFTTKEVGKGTGQGLAIARDIIVNKHGGSIACDTIVGKGTTFILRLPRSVALVSDKAV